MDNHAHEKNALPIMDRRQLLQRCGTGLGVMGLAGLLGDERMLASSAQADSYSNPLAPKPPHFPAKAKYVIHLFMNGGPSHLDTFDRKPFLEKFAGKSLPEGKNLRTERSYSQKRPNTSTTSP